ncbi:hypothetical protein ACFCYB_03130 [Streptomyces sp. NPDC056309]|uniref:hypothetical protein n=1 Tax=unclassified Streptomyces TaxID=2593676 RepID=UPI0035DF1FD5
MTGGPTTAGPVRSGLDDLFRPLGGPGRTVAGPTRRDGGPGRDPSRGRVDRLGRTDRLGRVDRGRCVTRYAVGGGRTGDAAAPHDELADRARRQEREEPER